MIRIHRFSRWIKPSHFAEPRGITLLLVILVMSALITISVGIFNITFFELRISGELTNSFFALYAADQKLEEILYKDRVEQSICTLVQGEGCYAPAMENFPNGSCAQALVDKVGIQTIVRSVGQYDCISGSQRAVKRAFEVYY